MLFASCDQGPKGPTAEQYAALLAERDSIAANMNEMQDLIGSVTTSLDSINAQEGLLFINNEDGTKPSKRQILDRIDTYKVLLARQREQLAELQKKQNSSLYTIKQLKNMIAQLEQSITEKEERIQALEADLETSRRNIADLQVNLAQSQQATANMTEERDALQQVANAQDKIINKGYYLIASKKELKNLGFTKGVFKKKADYANFDSKQFKEIDIREFTELKFEGKNAKMITEKPANSYMLYENADGSYTLKISNPTAFWEASQYLIIQTK